MTIQSKYFNSVFAETIYLQKYAHDIDKRKESWPELADRVSSNVMKAVKSPDYLTSAIRQSITNKEFVPGGRYLYATGRQFHQTQNCLLMRAEDSREGWSEIMYKSTLALMTGAGIGIVYSGVRGERKLIKKTGGKSTGPLALAQMVNEAGRFIMQGGSRRSAIWAGLAWDHPDIFKFIHIKDWTKEVRDLKAKDFNFPATLDGTNISVTLNDEFFEAYSDEDHDKHNLAHMVYWETVKQMLKTAEPGFSIDVGENAGEDLRNAPVCGGTRVFTDQGWKQVIQLVGREARVWTGKQFATTVFKKTGSNVPVLEVTLSNGNTIACDPMHPFIFPDGSREVANDLREGDVLMGMLDPVKVLSVSDAGLADVFCCDVGVEEHSFCAEGVIISNCTEITSRDSDDICNLGSINMANINSLDQMKSVVKTSIAFLLAGTVYSDVPYPRVDQIRTKNRRLGLGLMGVHEWLLKRGKRYGPDPELEEYLKIYAKSTEIAADFAEQFDLSKPKKTRAIAPTGTIGIVAETTTSLEPIFCVAYKRRYLKGNVFQYQYVVDPTAKRLIESGIKPEAIEDAYSLANDVERRVAFQAWTQQYVDHAISSTINLPSWGSELNNENRVTAFGDMLMKYLPKLRGVTCYPDGARDGQPLTAVSYSEAVQSEGEVFEEAGDVCNLKSGSCGS